MKSITMLRVFPIKFRGILRKIKVSLGQLKLRLFPKRVILEKIEANFGLKPNDKVQTTSEYSEMFEGKSFSGTVLYIKDGVATIVKDDGNRDALSCYWLTDGNPKYGN